MPRLQLVPPGHGRHTALLAVPGLRGANQPRRRAGRRVPPARFRGAAVRQPRQGRHDGRPPDGAPRQRAPPDYLLVTLQRFVVAETAEIDANGNKVKRAVKTEVPIVVEVDLVAHFTRKEVLPAESPPTDSPPTERWRVWPLECRYELLCELPGEGGRNPRSPFPGRARVHAVWDPRSALPLALLLQASLSMMGTPSLATTSPGAATAMSGCGSMTTTCRLSPWSNCLRRRPLLAGAWSSRRRRCRPQGPAPSGWRLARAPEPVAWTALCLGRTGTPFTHCLAHALVAQAGPGTHLSPVSLPAPPIELCTVPKLKSIGELHRGLLSAASARQSAPSTTPRSAAHDPTRQQHHQQARQATRHA